jgi:hypothetical protein
VTILLIVKMMLGKVEISFIRWLPIPPADAEQSPGYGTGGSTRARVAGRWGSRRVEPGSGDRRGSDRLR